MEKQELINQALDALKLSYSPYSHFKVAAAIVMKNGDVVKGANIENASYGLSMCAERNTVFKAHLDGYQKEEMVAMALVCDGHELPYPCGACRQVLSELFPLDAPIYITNIYQEKELTTSVRELLPYIFDKENLE
jgi:cytidine deaminase